jgi:hypothetical protein
MITLRENPEPARNNSRADNSSRRFSNACNCCHLPTGEAVNLVTVSNWKDSFWRNRKISNLRSEFSHRRNAQQDGQQHICKRPATINIGGDLWSIERTIISKMATVESTRGHREWWQDPDAFDHASAGEGTTRRRTRANSFSSSTSTWRMISIPRGKFCCTAMMKGQTSKNWRAILVSVLWTRLTLENWRAKLISLLVAMTIWYLIKKNMTPTPSRFETSSQAPVTETR